MSLLISEKIGSLHLMDNSVIWDLFTVKQEDGYDLLACPVGKEPDIDEAEEFQEAMDKILEGVARIRIGEDKARYTRWIRRWIEKYEDGKIPSNEVFAAIDGRECPEDDVLPRNTPRE